LVIFEGFERLSIDIFNNAHYILRIMNRSLSYACYFFGIYWIYFVFAFVYILKNQYSLLLYYAGFPFRTIIDSNFAYVLSSLFYFLVGALLGFIIDFVVSTLTDKKINKKIRTFNKLTGKSKKVNVVIDLKRRSAYR